MNAFLSSYKIRSAQIEDLPALAEIEQAAATLFCDTPYAFLVDAKALPLDFVTQQFRAGRVWVAVDDCEISVVGYAIRRKVAALRYRAGC